MNYKIFELSNGAKVMVMETKGIVNVNFYLQINTSNWSFCVSYEGDFDKVDKAVAEYIAEQYYDSVDNDERLIIEVAETKMNHIATK